MAVLETLSSFLQRVEPVCEVSSRKCVEKFSRLRVPEDDFTQLLQQLPLKKSRESVLLLGETDPVATKPKEAKADEVVGTCAEKTKPKKKVSGERLVASCPLLHLSDFGQRRRAITGKSGRTLNNAGHDVPVALPGSVEVDADADVRRFLHAAGKSQNDIGKSDYLDELEAILAGLPDEQNTNSLVAVAREPLSPDAQTPRAAPGWQHPGMLDLVPEAPASRPKSMRSLSTFSSQSSKTLEDRPSSPSS